MEEEYSQHNSELMRWRDLEERQRLLKDRVLLIGQNLVQEREKQILELRELKKEVALLKEENQRIKDMLSNVAQQADKSARKEQLIILQHQLDLLRGGKNDNN